MSKSILTGVVFVVFFCGVTGAICDDSIEVAISPDGPTVNNEITFTVSGMCSDSCVPHEMLIIRESRSIYIDVIWNYERDVMCAQVISDWRLSGTIDPLDAGEYVVMTRIRGVSEYSRSAVFVVSDSLWYWPPEHVRITPEGPTAEDRVGIVLGGEWLDTCVPTGISISRERNNIYVDLELEYDRGTGCGDAITQWKVDGSIGQLEPGSYTVYGRIGENPMVPATRYGVLSEFMVRSLGETTLYRFVPKESTVVQSGGIAGIRRVYDVRGGFGLRVNHKMGVARFVDVDAVLVPQDRLGTEDTPDVERQSLGDLFNMENLKSTSVSEEGIRFEGTLPNEPDAPIVIEVGYGNAGVRIVGAIRPGCCDRFMYDLEGFAVIVPDEIVCREPLHMDFNDDCRVDLGDFAIFARAWLSCNRIPESACFHR